MLWMGRGGQAASLASSALLSTWMPSLNGMPAAGGDEGDELGAVDLAPAGLGGVEELVGHHQAPTSGAGAFGDLGA